MVKRLLAVILILLWGCSTVQRPVRTVPAMLMPPEQPLNRPAEAFRGPQTRFPGQDKTFSPDGNPTPLTVNWSLEWDPSPDPDVIAYRVYYGPLPRSYTNSLVVGGTTANIQVSVLTPLFYAVTAISTNGLESDFSEEINFATLNGSGIEWELTTNKGPTSLTAEMSTNLRTWQAVSAPYTFDQPKAFYRLKLN